MAEGQQSDIADQEIERQGEQREADRLHQKHGIDEDRSYDEEADHDGKRDRLAPGRSSRGRYADRFSHVRHHAVLPNSPAGRIKSTIAMMTKMTVFDASG